MKKQSFKFLAVAILLSVSAVFVSAKSNNVEAKQLLNAEIPFEFQLNGERFPAGNYKIRFNLEDDFLMLEGKSKKAFVLLSSSTLLSSNNKNSNPKILLFHQYGKKNFLRLINSESYSFNLRESKNEKRIRKNGNEEKMLASITMQ